MPKQAKHARIISLHPYAGETDTLNYVLNAIRGIKRKGVQVGLSVSAEDLKRHLAEETWHGKRVRFFAPHEEKIIEEIVKNGHRPIALHADETLQDAKAALQKMLDKDRRIVIEASEGKVRISRELLRMAKKGKIALTRQARVLLNAILKRKLALAIVGLSAAKKIAATGYPVEFPKETSQAANDLVKRIEENPYRFDTSDYEKISECQKILGQMKREYEGWKQKQLKAAR